MTRGVKRRRQSGLFAGAVLVVLAVAALLVRSATGHSGSATPSRPGPAISAVPADLQNLTATSAGTVLAGLEVKGRAPKTGYARSQFGEAWTDDNDDPLGHNGCDTRNDILGRDLTGVSYRSGRCVIARGSLTDPYSARVIAFVRGDKTSEAVQIDHVVALSDAWQSGAQQLAPARRIDLANDPLNLLAVDGPTNQDKSDGDAASWLPPNRAYRCAYVARQIAVKAKYGLWVTSAERAAIAQVLTACPGQTVPGE